MNDTPINDFHIDDFYRDCARILLQLYRYFPRRSLIYVEDIAGPGETDDFGLACDRHQSCFGAMLWLAEQHYLSFSNPVGQEAIDQAVLSQRGFNLLANLETEADFYQQPNLDLSPRNLTRAELINHKVKRQSSATLSGYIRYLLTL